MRRSGAHLELVDAVDLGELHGVVKQGLGDDVQHTLPLRDQRTERQPGPPRLDQLRDTLGCGYHGENKAFGPGVRQLDHLEGPHNRLYFGRMAPLERNR